MGVQTTESCGRRESHTSEVIDTRAYSIQKGRTEHALRPGHSARGFYEPRTDNYPTEQNKNGAEGSITSVRRFGATPRTSVGEPGGRKFPLSMERCGNAGREDKAGVST